MKLQKSMSFSALEILLSFFPNFPEEIRYMRNLFDGNRFKKTIPNSNERTASHVLITRTTSFHREFHHVFL